MLLPLAAARPDPALLAALRARIAALDGWAGAVQTAGRETVAA